MMQIPLIKTFVESLCEILAGKRRPFGIMAVKLQQDVETRGFSLHLRGPSLPLSDLDPSGIWNRNENNDKLIIFGRCLLAHGKCVLVLAVEDSKQPLNN